MNTGAFAKLCGVEKRTLFHYDDIGLLRPAAVRENGYREYLPEQVHQMDAIKILQASGYTLSEIRTILAGSPESRAKALGQAENRLEAQVRRLQQMQGYLQRKLALYREYRAIGPQCPQSFQGTICFDRKPLDIDSHYFAFLGDQFFSAFWMDASGPTSLCRISPEGKNSVTGSGISFFLEIPESAPDLGEKIAALLQSWDFPAETPWLAENLPHFLLDTPGQALLKVLAFRQGQAAFQTL